MEIIFLGTSAGVPTKSRNVSAIALIESKGRSWHLIDCGEGTQHQLLHSHLSLNSLSTVFLTHLHGDHCYGLPGLLASAGLHGRTKPLKIVAPKGAKEWVELTQRISDLYLPYELEFVLPDEVKHRGFGQFSVSSIVLSHRIASFGFAFTETNVQRSIDIEKIKRAKIPKGPLWGRIQAGEDIEFNGVLYRANDLSSASASARKVIICGDNDQPDLLKHECKNCDVLVHESTFADDMKDRAKGVGHSYAQLIASFAQKAGVANLVLTHFSARYANDDNSLKNEARMHYLGNLYIAGDFDRFRLNSLGELELASPENT